MRNVILTIVIGVFGFVTTSYASIWTSIGDGQGLSISPSGEHVIYEGRGSNTP